MKIAFFEIHDWEIEILKKEFSKHTLKFFKEELKKENISKAADCQAISVFIYSKINNDILEKLPNLKYITTRSMGTDHIDLEVCREKGIKVSNAPHYGDNSVAEHTFGLILSLSRNIHKAYVRELKEDYSIEGLQGFDIGGKTLGVIGVGRIGRNVVKIARAFEMNVLANDHHPDEAYARELGFKYTTINDVLKNSDIITIHVPYCKENRHLIDSKALKLMKKGAILINTARGPIVDTKALMKALDSNKLSGLGIDVIEGEELIKEEKELLHHPGKLNSQKMRQILIDHEILENEKVIFTPHIAFYSKEAVHRILNVTIENLQAFIKNKPVNLVN